MQNEKCKVQNECRQNLPVARRQKLPMVGRILGAD
jgi:hypothetical protein